MESKSLDGIQKFGWNPKVWTFRESKKCVDLTPNFHPWVGLCKSGAITSFQRGPKPENGCQIDTQIPNMQIYFGLAFCSSQY